MGGLRRIGVLGALLCMRLINHSAQSRTSQDTYLPGSLGNQTQLWPPRLNVVCWVLTLGVLTIYRLFWYFGVSLKLLVELTTMGLP